MKSSPFVLLSLGLVQVTIAARASAQSDSVARASSEVRTSATVERRVRPDFATFTLTFDATGPTPLAAGRTVAARAESLRNALVALGIPRDSMETGKLGWRGRVEKTVLPPRYVSTGTDTRGRETRAEVIDTVFRATDAISVRVHDLRIVGAALDTALAHQVTNVSELQFRATDVTSAQESALREATEQAQRKAKAMAEASGGRLGKTLLLTTQAETEPRYYGLSLEASSFSGARQGTEIVERSVPVSVTVSGRWELVARP